MTASLRDYRLVFGVSGEGQTAVGDYSEDFISSVRQYFGEVQEVRSLGPSGDTVAQIRRYRQTVAQHVATDPSGRVLVHAELAAGRAAAFWSIAGLCGTPVTATIHAPPHGVWRAAAAKFIFSRKLTRRLFFHGDHYPMRLFSVAIEGRVNGRRTQFALTETGRQSIAKRYPRSNPIHAPHIVCDRSDIPPAQNRPKAVGFFGHVYRGKGFEQIARIRQLLPDYGAIRVGGRGTESLPKGAGIGIIGAIEGPDEDAFFASVQVIVAPYGKRHWCAETYPASGVVARATAYRKPVVCTAYGSLAELNEKTGPVLVQTDSSARNAVATNIAIAIEDFFDDEPRLTELGEHAQKTRHARSGLVIAEAFAAVWSDMLARHRGGH